MRAHSHTSTHARSSQTKAWGHVCMWRKEVCCCKINFLEDLLTLVNWRHLSVLNIPSEKDTGGDVWEGRMSGMWFSAGSQHTASFAFCNWSVLSESCSTAQLSDHNRGWTGCLSECVCELVSVCVSVCVFSHEMPLNWMLPFLIQMFVFFGPKWCQRGDKFKLHIYNDRQ